MYSYGVLGRHLLSDIPLALPPWDGMQRPVFRLVAGEAVNAPVQCGESRSEYRFGDIACEENSDAGILTVTIGSRLCFTIDAAGTITSCCRPAVPEQLLLRALIGVVFPIYSSRNSVLTFHGSAICTPDLQHGIMLLGNKGAGKSTAAAWLTGCGYRLLGDDMVPAAVADGSIRLLPGVAMAQLTPSAFLQLCGEDANLPGAVAAGDKVHWMAEPCHESVPASLVIILSTEPDLDRPALNRVRGMQKVGFLTSHLSMLPGIDLPAHQFAALAGNLAALPMWSITRGSGESSPEPVIEQILRVLSDYPAGAPMGSEILSEKKW